MAAREARTKTGKKVTRSGAKPKDQPRTQAKAAEPQEAPALVTQAIATPESAVPFQDDSVEVHSTPKHIRLITNVPRPEAVQTMMGRRISPFAKPAQSGAFAPFAVAQARRGR